jgi:hypothetical protein
LRLRRKCNGANSPKTCGTPFQYSPQYAEGPQYKKAYLICNTDHRQLAEIIATAPADGTATAVRVSGRLKELCSADPGYSATCPAAYYLDIDVITK